jgi:hypothetical protein
VVVALLLVTGLILAYQRLDRREVRHHLAAPLALLLGGFVFLLLIGIARGGARNAPVQSRFEHVLFAMSVPALGVAADAIMQRSRWRTITVVVVLLACVPGNIQRIVSTEHTRGANSVAYRRMILTVPRLPVAQQVPRSMNPDRMSLWVTVGWLLDGVASGRIPAPPGGVRGSELAFDTLRLSVLQRWGDDVNRACRPVGRGVLVKLSPGARITVFGKRDDIRLYPEGAPPTDAYPMTVSRNFGPTLVAIRPITFRVTARGPNPARVCGPVSSGM